ncbi:hypothetical protein F4553_006837 [Allocatelliglobosispora scoriae]|uniref:F5/8 type C domain-containing protein n=1 Tax=Allocatelliglobosispora scoriae TaxID=643052 RepID=A0A841C2Q2_9ACTN|nr:choice-of-anchor D domain-containing protein [Allocatelliglobosispora scoriae]MBB5873403.1 hypothetical protein [Allocatelliglobosispora scoriae]
MKISNPAMRIRALAIGTTGALAASVLAVIGLAAPAPAAVTAGAPVPFVEQQAVNAQTNGTVLAKNFYFGALASEATGRQAVQLVGQGKYVEFTLTAPANAVNVHYSIPDSLDGTGINASLSLSVNGTPQAPLALTSKNSWLYGSNPPEETNTPFVSEPGTSAPHAFYDDVRTMFSSTLPVGAKVRLQVGANDTAPWYAINTAEFELVAPALSKPAGFLDATAAPYNADASGLTDSTQKLQDAVNAASAQGVGLFLPAGLYKVSAPIYVNNVTITGAGQWYTKLTGYHVEFAGQIGNPSTNVNVSHLAMFGNVNTRDDADGTVHAFNGGFTNSTIHHVWMQNHKVGIWVVGPTDHLTIDSNRILDTTADGINFHGSVTNSTIKNTFIRNTQDDGIAFWSSPGADVNNVVDQNTVNSPGIANNIALYGSTGTTISNNLLQDTVTRGGGIHLGRRFGGTAFAGVTTITGNRLVRTGQFDPGWDYHVGAIWTWPLDGPIASTVNITNNEIVDSPGAAFHLQNQAPPVGAGVTTQGVNGNTATGITISNNTVTNVGTFVFQLQGPGSAAVSGTVATGVGTAGVFNCNSGFTLNQGSGNSGWSTTACGLPPTALLYAFPTTTTFHNATVGQATPSQKVTIFNAAAAAATIGAVSASSGFTVTPDSGHPCGTTLALSSPGDPNVWCQVNVSFTPSAAGTTTGTLTIPSNQPGSPTVLSLVGSTGSNVVITPPTVTPTSLQFGSVNVGSTSAPQTLTLANPGTAPITVSSITASAGFSQTNACPSTLAAGASCTITARFSPTAGGAVTGTIAITNSGTQTPIGASLTGLGISSTTNLAQGAPITASSSTGGFGPGQANDGNTTTYWESAANAFPQTLTVDLGSVVVVGSVRLHLPPAPSWATRTETITVLGSSNGTDWAPLSGAAGRVFDPATGNTVTIGLPNSSVRYVRLAITGNTGWPAGQISEFAVFPGTGGGTATLAASPSSIAFGNQAVGTTGAPQTVTVTNTGTVSAAVSGITVSGAFLQTTTCGSAIAAGASCTVSARFAPTATGPASGSLTVASNATNPTLTVALTGTGTTVGTATLVASPTSLGFGNQTVGSTSAGQTVTVTNSGTVAASIGSVTVSGAFTQSTTCGSALAAGASCTATVRFAPTATGAASGTLTVASNATNPTLAVALTGTGTTATTTNLALGKATTTSSVSQSYGGGNAVDGNPGTYWESANNAFPQWITVDLGSASTLSSVVLSVPPAWGARTQTLSVLGSGDGSAFTTLVASAAYAFNPGGSVTIGLPAGTSSRFVRVTVTGNSAWPAAQLAEFAVMGVGRPDLALNRPTTASGSTQTYLPGNATDGNTSSYWEGVGFPSTLTVDLGSAQAVGSVVLNLPPSASWASRTETLSVLGSTDGTTFTPVVASAGYTFNPATGNTVTITFTSTTIRHVRLNITANSGGSSGQISGFSVFGS